MKFTLLRVALTSLTLGVCSSGFAQESVPIEYYRPLRNSVSVGIRMIGGNAKVNFKNLGNIPSRASTLSDQGRAYDNGSWISDTQRTDESNADALYGIGAAVTQTSGTVTTQTWTDRNYINGTNRYQLVDNVSYVDSANPATNYTTQRIRGEFANHVADHTRGWAFNSTDQIGESGGAPYVDMSDYNVTTAGGSAQAEGENSRGIELQFAHIIKRYKRFEWGVNFSAGVSDINVKTRQLVRANLIKTTDRYGIRTSDSSNNVIGASSFPNWWYNSTADLISVDANSVVTGAATSEAYTYNSEQYKFLQYTNPLSTGAVSYGNADVYGYWQVKGAYYMLRVGPTARFELSKKWTISASIGVAGAFAGTRFIADEFILLDDVSGPIRVQEESEEKRIVPGYYGDINIERWITVRTGFYLGYGYEKLGDYTQHLGARSAQIDLGTSSGFRFGVITRF
jgi:hypothetical protein